MPRSCSSSDMAGTAMLYPPGTDGAAVTDVRLHGSRSSQHPESRNTRTSWNRGFIAFGLVRRTVDRGLGAEGSSGWAEGQRAAEKKAPARAAAESCDVLPVSITAIAMSPR